MDHQLIIIRFKFCNACSWQLATHDRAEASIHQNIVLPATTRRSALSNQLLANKHRAAAAAAAAMAGGCFSFSVVGFFSPHGGFLSEAYAG
jgi:hypothetical protein